MKVLLGMGGSEDSFRALDRTLERAQLAGDDLVIAILENPVTDISPEEVRTRVEQTVAGTSLDVEVRHLEGDPRRALTELADGGEFDQLVLGGGQRSPMGKIRVGEIAEYVLLNATTTVKLVR